MSFLSTSGFKSTISNPFTATFRYQLMQFKIQKYTTSQHRPIKSSSATLLYSNTIIKIDYHHHVTWSHDIYL